MLKWLQDLADFINPKPKYVLTSKGKVARIEKINHKLNNILISFGSFDTKGNWIISKTVTISKINVTSFLDREDVAKRLTLIYKDKKNK